MHYLYAAHHTVKLCLMEYFNLHIIHTQPLCNPCMPCDISHLIVLPELPSLSFCLSWSLALEESYNGVLKQWHFGCITGSYAVNCISAILVTLSGGIGSYEKNVYS